MARDTDRDNAVIGVTVTSRVLPGSVSRALSLIPTLYVSMLMLLFYTINSYRSNGIDMDTVLRG